MRRWSRIRSRISRETSVNIARFSRSPLELMDAVCQFCLCENQKSPKICLDARAQDVGNGVRGPVSCVPDGVRMSSPSSREDSMATSKHGRSPERRSRRRDRRHRRAIAARQQRGAVMVYTARSRHIPLRLINKAQAAVSSAGLRAASAGQRVPDGRDTHEAATPRRRSRLRALHNDLVTLPTMIGLSATVLASAQPRNEVMLVVMLGLSWVSWAVWLMRP